MSMLILSKSRDSPADKSAVVPSDKPDDRLQVALLQFREALTPHQRGQFQAYRDAPDPAAVLKLMAEVDAEQAKRNERCIGTRLRYVLDSVQQFSSVVDTLVSARPDTAALVWGSIKFAILVAVNVSPYLTKVTQMFMELRDQYPRLSQYQTIYKDCPRVQTALCSFYAELIRCCKYLISLVNRQGFLDTIKSAFWPFDKDFQQLKAQIQHCGNEVKAEIDLASRELARREQELQALDRKESSGFRDLGRQHFKKAREDQEQERKWRLSKDSREAERRKQRILEKLSSHNYFNEYKRARIKQLGATTKWVTETSEFQNWLQISPSAFWFSGKLGSGKTIATANVINYLQTKTSIMVVYVFCRFDDEDTQTARGVVGSLFRQYIERQGLSGALEAQLTSLLRFSKVDVDALLDIFCKETKEPLFIVVDGLDECPDQREQTLLLGAFERLQSRGHTRIFFSSRDSLKDQINRLLGFSHYISTSCNKSHSSVLQYIENRLAEVYDGGQLKLGSSALIEVIKDTMKENVQGMFLWASLLIDDLCSQGSDEEILRTLADLPKDLPAIYTRIVNRILHGQQSNLMHDVFGWVIIATQPLSLSQIREAIAIEPCQPYTKPERLHNDISRVIEWSCSLLTVDEEDSVVQFTHPSVKQFFLLESQQETSLFKYELDELDVKAGEICVTYLNFSDFERTLSKRARPNAVSVENIINTSMANEAREGLPRLITKFRQHRMTSRTGSFKDLNKVLESTRGGLNTQDATDINHQFLKYASCHWLHHTRSWFPSADRKTYHLWKELLEKPRTHASIPWDTKAWEEKDDALWDWILDHDHAALFEYIRHRPLEMRSGDQLVHLLLDVFRRGKHRIVKAYSPSSFDLPIVLYVLTELLTRMSYHGHVPLIDDLLKQGAFLSLTVEIGRKQLQDFLDDHGSIIKYEVMMLWLEKNGSFFREQMPLLRDKWSSLDTDIQQSRMLHQTSGLFASETGAKDYGWSYRTLALLDGHEEPCAYITPLVAAILGHSHHAVFILIDAGAQVNGIQVDLAVVEHITQTEYRRLAPVDCKKEGRVGLTPLMVAITIRQIQSIELLLGAGADTGGWQGFRGNPLVSAVHMGLEEEALILLKIVGFSIVSLLSDMNGVSLLSAAILNRLDRVATLLIHKAAESKIYKPILSNDQYKGPSPLIAASATGNLKMTNALMAAGALIEEPYFRSPQYPQFKQLHFPNTEKIAALHTASYNGHTEIVRVLLKAGANPQQSQNKPEESALFFAIKGRHVQAAMLLVEHDAVENNQEHMLPHAQRLIEKLCSDNVSHNSLKNYCRPLGWLDGATEIMEETSRAR